MGCGNSAPAGSAPGQAPPPATQAPAQPPAEKNDPAPQEKHEKEHAPPAPVQEQKEPVKSTEEKAESQPPALVAEPVKPQEEQPTAAANPENGAAEAPKSEEVKEVPVAQPAEEVPPPADVPAVVPPAPAEDNADTLSFQALLREDDVTTATVCRLLATNSNFEALSVSEGQSIQERDTQDGAKLSVGIHISISKGVISSEHGASDPTQINVVGKSADEVAASIVSSLPTNNAEGNVIVLVGLSGTGKGTTVAKLQKLLPNVITWSNGNVFRALTKLIVTDACESVLKTEDVTAERVKAAVEKLSFEKFEDETGKPTFDVVIDKTTRVSQIQNTTLKTPTISTNVPTVAEQTQGEVILFAREAVKTLQSNGFNVILEGRAQTLNYIPTEHRFELVMPEVKLLGQRRAAQRVIAHTVGSMKVYLEDTGKEPSNTDVVDALGDSAWVVKNS